MNALKTAQLQKFTERLKGIKNGPEFMRVKRLEMFNKDMEAVFYIGNRLDEVDPEITRLYVEAKEMEGVGVCH